MSESSVAVVEWISAEAAAERLGISKRRVLEYAQAGALQRRKMRDTVTSQMAIQVHAGDVERLRDERENPKPQASAEVARQYVATRKGAARTAPRADLPPSELRNKVFLSEDEVIQLTGLGREFVRNNLPRYGRVGPRGAAVYHLAMVLRAVEVLIEATRFKTEGDAVDCI